MLVRLCDLPAVCLVPGVFWRDADNIIGSAVSNHNKVEAALDKVSESRPKLLMQEWWQWATRCKPTQ